MRYVKSRYRTQQRELAYRVYVTDALHWGFKLDRRYYDIINGRTTPSRQQNEEKERAENQERVQKLLDKFKD